MLLLDKLSQPYNSSACGRRFRCIYHQICGACSKQYISHHYEKRHSQNQVETMSPSSAVLSKILGTSSSRDISSKNSQQQQQQQHLEQEYEPEPKVSFTDRRKLNAKELRLELSRGYEDTGYSIKRSESFQRTSTLSRVDSISHCSEHSDKVDQHVVECKQGSVKALSTPIHTSVAQSISSYSGSFGILIPQRTLQHPRHS